MIAPIFLYAAGEIMLRHPHAAGVVVADVKRNQIATIIIVLRDIVDGSRAAEAVHDPKSNGVCIKNWRQHAANGSLLRPHFAAHRLLIPKISPILCCGCACKCFWIGPGRFPFETSRLVDNPFPWD